MIQLRSWTFYLYSSSYTIFTPNFSSLIYNDSYLKKEKYSIHYNYFINHIMIMGNLNGLWLLVFRIRPKYQDPDSDPKPRFRIIYKRRPHASTWEFGLLQVRAQSLAIYYDYKDNRFLTEYKRKLFLLTDPLLFCLHAEFRILMQVF